MKLMSSTLKVARLQVPEESAQMINNWEDLKHLVWASNEGVLNRNSLPLWTRVGSRAGCDPRLTHIDPPLPPP